MNKKELKKILEKDYAWGNLNAEDNKWFIDELLDDFVDILKKQLTLTDVVQQSEQYCECDKPTLGKSVSRCGTCDEWFKPLK